MKFIRKISIIIMLIFILTMYNYSLHGGLSMEISNPPDRVDFIKAVTGEILRPYVIDIGDWNMDTDSYVDVTLPVGLDHTKIRMFSIIVRNDAGTNVFDIGDRMENSADPSLVAGGHAGASSESIQINRRTGGVFDNALYQNTDYNRGWVIIWVDET